MSSHFLDYDDTKTRLEQIERLSTSKPTANESWLPTLFSTPAAVSVSVMNVKGLAPELDKKADNEVVATMASEVARLKRVVEILTEDIDELRVKKRDSASSFEIIDDE